MTSIQTALDAFLASPDFQAGVISSTKAARAGESHCSVELFPDGTYRIVWSGHLGKKYDPPGEILQLPALGIDPSELEKWLSADGNSEEEFLRMQFDCERAELEEWLWVQFDCERAEPEDLRDAPRS